MLFEWIKKLFDELTRHQEMTDYEARLVRLRREISELIEEIKEYNGLKNNTKSEILKKKEELRLLKESILAEQISLEMKDYGLYPRIFEYSDSKKYKEEIEKNAEKQKLMIRNKTACLCSVAWQVNNSEDEGLEMTNRNIKLTLRAFNGECDYLIGKTTYRNLESLKNRIDKSFNDLNKLGESNKIYISRDYLALKKEELHLVFQKKEIMQREKEEAAERARELKEAERDRRENEKMEVRLRKEKEEKSRIVETLRNELEMVHQSEMSERLSKIKELEAIIAELSDKERRVSQAQLTRAGYVYVLSNIGAFGEGVYKIGLTRRAEPLERVKELSSASVPFKFDCHGMVWASDAVALEKSLHEEFDQYRVNKANNRKEYFRIDLEQIEEAIRKTHPDVELITDVLAEEYYKTLDLLSEGGVN